MSTLQDRLADLADLVDQPDVGRPPRATGRDLWDRGVGVRRQRRVGVAAVLSGAAVLLVVLGTVTWARVPRGDSRPADAPIGVPDHLFGPSPWLPGTAEAGPPGPLAFVLDAPRESLFHSTPYVPVGVSATSGTYRFLDLPGWSPSALVSLAPDGRHVAYWTRGSAADASGPVDNGLAIYDTTTGHTATHPLASSYGVQEEQLTWAGSDTLLVQYAESTPTSELDAGSTISQPPAPLLRWQVDDPAPTVWPVHRTHVEIVAATSQTAALYRGTFHLVRVDTGADSGTLPAVSGFSAHPALDPSGTRLAVLATPAGGGSSQQRVSIVSAAGRRMVPGGLESDEIEGWTDADHVLVETASLPGAVTAALVELDVRTGSRRTLTTYALDDTIMGVQVASGLAGAGAVPAIRPPSPIGARMTVVLAGVILLGTALSIAGVLLSSRRRARVRR